MNGCGILFSVGVLVWLVVLFLTGFAIEMFNAPTVPTFLIAIVLGNLLVVILIWIFFKIVDRLP